MSKYDINYSGGQANDKLSILMLPFELRKSRLINLLWCINAPVRRMILEFHAFMADKNYRMEHTGQVTVLTTVLRVALSTSSITISDSINYQEIFLTPSAEGDDANYQLLIPAGSGSNQILVGNRDTYQEFGHFVVNIPSSFTADQELKVRKLVDIYKLAGKFYKIHRA